MRVFPLALAAAVLLTTSMHAAATEPVTVFLLDAKYNPVVRLEKLTPPLSEPLRAILAMYALQVGGGCESDTDTGVQCDLTDALGVGPQCSAKQFKLIREWFIDIPQISGHQPDDYKNIRRPDVLEMNCYSSPIIATFQQKWEKIRVKQDGAQISVDAVGSYLSRGDSGQFHYRSTYKVEGHSITVQSHEKIPTKKRHQDQDETDDDAAQ